MHLLITRPKIQSEALQVTLEKMGHRVLQAPLLEITFENPPLDLSSLQTIIVTSQNAVRGLASHPLYLDIVKIPLVAVGRSTAELARQLGFHVMVEGNSGGRELANKMKNLMDPRVGPLLHVTGDDIAVDLKEALGPFGFDVRRSMVYQMKRASSLPKVVVDALQRETLDGIVLMSPRTSNVWIDLIMTFDLVEKAQIPAYFCLSKAVAAPLEKFQKQKIYVPAEPNLDKFLTLIGELSSSLSG